MDRGCPVGVIASVSFIGAFRFLEPGKFSTHAPRSLYPPVHAHHRSKISALARRRRGLSGLVSTHANQWVEPPGPPVAALKTLLSYQKKARQTARTGSGDCCHHKHGGILIPARYLPFCRDIRPPHGFSAHAAASLAKIRTEFPGRSPGRYGRDWCSRPPAYVRCVYQSRN